MKNGSGTPKQAAKRFYKTVAVEAAGLGWQVTLDGRGIKTPQRRALLLPTQALAQAIAGEWDAQTGRIDPRTMPQTKLANTALDGVIGREAAVADEIVAYAANDLLCYRAERPQDLVRLQNERWDPLLTWAYEAFGARLIGTMGIMPVAQPDASIARLGEAIHALDAYALAACHVMTTLTGSAVLALACIHGRLSLDETWAAAHVDEDFQIGRWGEDVEAAKRRELRQAEMGAAADFYRASRVESGTG